MDTPNDRYTTIDEYIGGFPAHVQEMLEVLRQTIRAEAPEAVEAISYRMPTFRLNGRNLVHFAAHPRHIGFYPTPSAIEAFKNELAPYKWAKGSVQFPIDQPLPIPLIRRMVAYRVQEEREARAKKRTRTKRA